MSNRIPLLVVGAGPQGLAVAAYAKHLRGVDATVVDPAGLMGRWNDNFERLAIPHLDSPLGAHPHPDRYALARFIGREPSDLADPDIHATTDDFRRFCEATADEFGITVQRTRVMSLEIVGDAVRARMSDGSSVDADRAVIATSPSRPVIPEWAMTRAHGDGSSLDRYRVTVESALSDPIREWADAERLRVGR